MPNKKNLKPLGRGNLTPEQEHEIRAKGARMANRVKHEKAELRKWANMVMAQKPTIPQKQIAQLKAMGFDEDKIDLWALGMAGLVTAMSNGNSGAARMILEITGNDANSMLQKERLKIERERLELQKKQIEFAMAQTEEKGQQNGQLDKLIDGLNEIGSKLCSGSIGEDEVIPPV